MTPVDGPGPPPAPPYEESAEDLYEHAPCGYLSTLLDGRIVRVNQTFIDWTGYERAGLLDGRRFQDILAPGSRMFYETHLSGILRVSGRVREVAAQLLRPDGGRMDVLLNAARRDVGPAVRGRALVRFIVLDASERRRYERELLEAKRQAEEALERVRQLEGLLPVCAWCRKIRSDTGEWQALEEYLGRSGAQVTHAICEPCAKESGLDR